MTLFIKMFLFEEIPVYTLEFKAIEPKSIIPEDDAMKKEIEKRGKQIEEKKIMEKSSLTLMHIKIT